MPIIPENIMPMAVSGVTLFFSEMGPKTPDVTTTKTKAPINGFIPKRRPKRTPKNAAWLIHIPRKEILRDTSKTPIREQDTPANMTARSDLINVISIIKKILFYVIKII